MANRYWVGGTASWDGTAGTKWSDTSGGTGGFSVPTTADDVFFDAASTGTCTIATGNTGAKSITCTGFTGTIAGTAAISVAGSITLVAGMTYSHTGTVTFTGTGTLTTAGKTFSAVTVDAAGITLTLGDALNIAGRNIFVTSGTFDSANYNITANAISSNNSNTRTIILGSSTVTLAGAGGVIQFTTSTNLTFNAGTSQINLSNRIAGIDGGGQTFYNVTFDSGTNNLGPKYIAGNNTFNNLTLVAAGGGIFTLQLSGNQTVNGTLTCAGASASIRNFVCSNTIGTSRTITAATLSANDCDFRDITIAGGAAGTSPTRAGDCGGNSGITFPAAKTVYRVGTNTTWVGSSSWATGSGGTGNDNNLPLAQDTAVIDNSTTLTGTLALAAYNIGALDCTNRTTGITINYNASATWYGSHTFASGVTVSGTTSQTFAGRGTMTFTSAGKTTTFPIAVNAVTGTFRLGDALSSSQSVTLTSGTLDLNNFSLTANNFSSTNSNTRTIAFGTGSISVTGTGLVWDSGTITNLTVTGTPVVNVTSAGSTSITVSPGQLSEANSISYNFTGGTYALTMSTCGVRNLNFTGFAGTLGNALFTIYGDLVLSTGMTLTGGTSAMTFAATSGTKDITSNGKTYDFPVELNGVGGTWRLQDAMTLGSTRRFRHTNGTLNLNGKTLTVGSEYNVNTGTKNLTFNGGTLVCPAASTIAFNNGAPTGFTTTAGTGTGKISMTAATAKTFVGGGSTFDCTLSNDGAGAMTITGSNTFTTLANGVQPTTFTFTAATTTTVTNWSVSGTAGNLVTIGSATAASHTLSKSSGTVSADYLSISRSTATGGAAWYAGANSTNGGNNSGWIFTAPPAPSVNGNFFFMFG